MLPLPLVFLASPLVFSKPDESGSGNPDPTMKKGPGSPKGENMPPAGGESMAPADSERAPAPPGGADDQTSADEDEE